MLQPGDIIGDYEVLDELSSGGMGTLFLARRSGAAGFGRRVAIKIIHPHLARDRNFVRLFVDEALLAARIDHPNVVRVDELREARGTYFQVMEYVAGCSLAQLLRALARLRRRMTPAVAVAIAAQVADGLHAAHETVDDEGRPLGVVHRDVSPQNVLLGEAGHVKLIDFGVAKARGRERTATGHLRGKLRYMAPEQTLRGEVDRRADIYALGAVLWEMLTERRLHETDDEFELLARVRAPQIAPPGSVVRGIPAALDAAVMDALAADPARRPLDAMAFRARILAAVPEALGVDSSRLAGLLALVSGHRGHDVDAEGTPAVLDESTRATRDQAVATSTVEIADGTPVGFDDFDDSGNPRRRSSASSSTAAGAEVSRRASVPPSAAANHRAIWYVTAAVLLAGVVGIGIGLSRVPGADRAPTVAPLVTAPSPSPPPSSVRPALAESIPQPTAPQTTAEVLAAPPSGSASVAPAATSPTTRRERPGSARRARARARRASLVHGVPLADEVAR